MGPAVVEEKRLRRGDSVTESPSSETGPESMDAGEDGGVVVVGGSRPRRSNAGNRSAATMAAFKGQSAPTGTRSNEGMMALSHEAEQAGGRSHNTPKVRSC